VEGDGGDGLAEPHVIREASTQAETGEPVQPGQATQLVPAQGGLQPGGKQQLGIRGVLRCGQPFVKGDKPSVRPHRDDGSVVARHLTREDGRQCLQGAQFA
jgi:hypothetical protein